MEAEHPKEVRAEARAARAVGLREVQGQSHQAAKLKEAMVEEKRLVVVVQLSEEPEAHQI